MPSGNVTESAVISDTVLPCTSVSTSDRCVECGFIDPPSTCKCRRKDVQWVQCDVCDFWYNLCCTDLLSLPTKAKHCVYSVLVVVHACDLQSVKGPDAVNRLFGKLFTNDSCFYC